jgi:hypothetical protein
VFEGAAPAAVGLLLGLSAVVVDRGSAIWFAICMSIAIGIMTVCYVAVPSRLIGTTPTRSRRDRLAASAIGVAIGAVVCAPPYVIARIGILMLGSSLLHIPGLLVLSFGVILHAGATGAIRAIKMSAKLIAGRSTPAATAPLANPNSESSGQQRSTTTRNRPSAQAEEPVAAEVDAEVPVERPDV